MTKVWMSPASMLLDGNSFWRMIVVFLAQIIFCLRHMCLSDVLCYIFLVILCKNSS